MATSRVLEKLTSRARQTDELADVVVAAESRDRANVPWYVRLRAWVFCLTFLLLAECGMRVVFDGTLCLQDQRFDNFPNPAALDAYVGQIKRDRAMRVVVLGDSVVVGPSLLDMDQTIPAYLEQALKKQNPGRDIHVWNLGIAGARSADLYCMLLKVLEAEPDLVVLESNFMMYTMDIHTRPVANTWLAYSLPAMPESIRTLVPERDYKRRIDETATWFVERNCRLFGLRQVFNSMVFGVQPRSPFETPNPGIMVATKLGKILGKLPMEPWNIRGITPATFVDNYEHPVRQGNLNGRFYPVIMDELRRHKIPAFIYMTPQNPAIIAGHLPESVYRYNLRAAAAFTTAPDFPSRDYSTLLPDNLFYDNDHLLAAGNNALAERIAQDMQPLMKTALAKSARALALAGDAHEDRNVHK